MKYVYYSIILDKLFICKYNKKQGAKAYYLNILVDGNLIYIGEF